MDTNVAEHFNKQASIGAAEHGDIRTDRGLVVLATPAAAAAFIGGAGIVTGAYAVGRAVG